MRKQIVIIGNTPLCLFLAELLDESAARLVHADIRWLTGPGQIVPLALQPTVLGAPKILRAKPINHVRVGRPTIKSISLADRWIITAKGVLNYDWLLIDQGQAITDEELGIIRGEIKKLMASLQASVNTKQKMTASVTVAGNGASAAQLLLALSTDLRQHPAIWRRLDLAAHGLKPSDLLKTALKAAGISLTTVTNRPGLKITTGLPLLSNQKIRGLRIDRAGRAMADASGRLEKFPEVTILDSQDRPWQTLLRFERTLAKKIAANIERLIEGEGVLPLELNGSATLLVGEKPIIQLGASVSSGLKAKAIQGIERRFLARR